MKEETDPVHVPVGDAVGESVGESVGASVTGTTGASGTRQIVQPSLELETSLVHSIVVSASTWTFMGAVVPVYEACPSMWRKS